MNEKNGFDTKKYLNSQVKKINDRVSYFDKLYLEFGGKLRYDHHASRVLPGFELDTKMRILERLGDKVEIIHCISAKDIERRKIRRDFGLVYDDQTLKDVSDLREEGFDVSAVVINRFDGEQTALKFKRKLENRRIRVFLHSEIPDYPNNLDYILSDKGYGSQEYVDTYKEIVVVTAPGPGSGKYSFCMSQIYNDRKKAINSGFSKYETFPVWNLCINHPVNIAYVAATADIGDYNVIDPYHMKAYDVSAVNYSRDVENFAILKKMIENIMEKDDQMSQIKSPTDMGVNTIKDGIINDDIVCEASVQEIIRRYFRYYREFVEGETLFKTVKIVEDLLSEMDITPDSRSVVLPARKAALEAKKRSKEGKGYEGIYCGAAIEITSYSGKKIIVTGKNSPMLYAESATILNGIKAITGIPDKVDVISREVIKSLIKLRKIIGMNSTSLDVKETLNALASSSVNDKNALICLEALSKIRSCEMHTTHLLDPSSEKVLKQMGINLTTDSKLPFPELDNSR